MKEVSLTTQGIGSVPSQSTPATNHSHHGGPPPAPRELVLYDIVLKNGTHVAEALTADAARTFVRVWNRLPRPHLERAYSHAIRWQPVQVE